MFKRMKKLFHVNDEGLKEDTEEAAPAGKWHCYMAEPRCWVPDEREEGAYNTEVFMKVAGWLNHHDFQWSFDEEEVRDLFFEKPKKLRKVWSRDETRLDRLRRWMGIHHHTRPHDARRDGKNAF